MKKGFLAALMACMMITSLLTACGSLKKDEAKTVKLDPDNPVTLKVWHYYNGNQQATFDKLLEKFNSTVGKEQGIYVEGYGHGSVADLDKALTSSVNEEVGAEDMPDIFSTYVYRKGLLNAQYSFAAAVGLANSLINIVILLTANFTAKKMTDTSIF